jgi:mediator of RNA polymerase II transcription subunit 5
VGAIKWLANHLWESHGDSNATVHILEIIVSPNSISNEASMMLSSILNIVAAPLEHALRSLQRAEPTRQDVEPLSKVLKPHLSFHRTASSDHTEMESWSSAHNGPLTNTIRRTIQQLVQWSFTPGINIMPTSYTHRQILLGVRVLGAKRLLLAIIDEMQHTASDHVAVVYDVAAAIICAPTADAEVMMVMAHNTGLLDETVSAPQPLQHRLTLREALKFEAETAAKRHKEPVERESAEMVIRLYRRVEAMMAGTEEMSGQAGLLHDGLGGLDARLQGGAGHGLGGHELGAIAGLEGGDMMHALGDGMMGLEDGMLDDMKLDF